MTSFTIKSVIYLLLVQLFTMQIKYFLKRLSLFLAFALCVYVLLLCVFSVNVFRNKIPNLLNIYVPTVTEAFHQLHSENNTDILFIGSSHAEFVPEVFKKDSINAINLSISMLRPMITYHLVKDEINKTSAKVVVLESYFTLFNEDYEVQEAALNILSNEEPDANLAKIAIITKDFRVINSSIGLLVYHMLHPLSIDKTKKTNLVIPDTNTSEPITFSKPNYCTVTHKAFVYFQQSIDLIKNAKKMPMLIMAPVPLQLIKSCLNYSTVCKSIDSIAKKNGLIFINYNDSVNYAHLGLDQRRSFVDDNHLSEAAKVKFSQVVVQDLKKLNVIQPHTTQ